MNALGQSDNPWLGLKSYSEGKRLYGRDREIEELSQRILYNTQTVIYGESGKGKSSLLKAGIFPILRRNGYFPVYVRLVHEDAQVSYTSQIKIAVEESLKCLKVEDLSALDDNMYQIVEGQICELVGISNAEREESLWEYFHRHKFCYKLHEKDEEHPIVPVLVFDQFEEIFTLQKNESIVKDFFDELAGLLNNVCPEYLLASTVETDSILDLTTKPSLIKKGLIESEKKWDYIDETNLHVVISLREDYLSYLERNIEHIPTLKHNRYCLLPLNEDQAAEVIMQPLPGLISIEVAKEIICKVTGASINDFEIDDTPELEVDSAILSLFLSELFLRKGDAQVISKEIVDLFGSNIISEFYEKTVNDRLYVSESSVHYLEEHLVTKDGRRDSIFKEQALRNGVTEAELKYLFASRLLHSYPWRDGVKIEFSHDVLCPIVIERKNKLEKQRQYEEFLRMKKGKQRFMYALLSVILILFALVVGLIDGCVDVKVKRYAYVVKEGTWMKGLKELSEHEASYLKYHYVFYQTGRYAKYPDSVEVRNGYGELTSEHNTGTYVVNPYDYSDNNVDQKVIEQLRSIMKWVFSPDKGGKYCIKESSFDEDGQLIYSLNNSIKEDDRVFVSTYVDEYGFPIIMRDSNYIYLYTRMDDANHEILQEFYDKKGYPIKNKDGAFQTGRNFFANGSQKSESSLFWNGHRMINRTGSCGWEILKLAPNGIDPLLRTNFDADRKPCRGNDSTMLVSWEYDIHGRKTKETYWRVADAYRDLDINELTSALDAEIIELIPDTNVYGVHGYIYKFNRYGQDTLHYAIDINEKLVKPSNEDYAKRYRQYDKWGNLVEEIKVNKEGTSIEEYFAEYSNATDLVFEKQYSINHEADTLMHLHVYFDKEKGRWIDKTYYNGIYKCEEYDIDGKVYLYACYKIDSQEPTTLYPGSRAHKVVYDYQNYNKDLKQLTMTQNYYDKDGYPCALDKNHPYFKQIILIDSVSHTMSAIQYTTPKILSCGVDTSVSLSEQFYQGTELLFNKDFTYPLCQSSVDSSRVKRRTYKNMEFYYRFKYSNLPSHMHENDSIWLYAENEFGEPSLVRRSDGFLFSAIRGDVYLDEYGHEIGEEILDRPFVKVIETNVDMGFEDGDILVQQDDWDLSSTCSYKGLDLTPQSNVDHHFKVLRFNEATKAYDVIEINIPKGDERVSYIKYKDFYVTKTEEKRIYNTIGNEIISPIKNKEITDKFDEMTSPDITVDELARIKGQFY